MPRFLTTRRHRCVGIDISAHAVTIVELGRTNTGFTLHGYAIEPLPTQPADDQTRTHPKSVAQVLLRVLGEQAMLARDAVVAVADGQLICKNLELDAGLAGTDLELHVRLEAEQHVPYALESAALDFEVQGRSPLNPQLMSVLLVACRMETLDWYQAVLSHAGLKAKVIEVQSHAQVRGIDAMASSSGAVALVDFATPTSRLSILHQGRVMDACELLFGEGVQDLDTFKTTAVQHIRRGLEQLAASPRAESVILAGPAAAHAGLSEWLQAQLGLPTQLANPFVHMDISPSVAPQALCSHAPMLLTACGLALRGFD